MYGAILGGYEEIVDGLLESRALLAVKDRNCVIPLHVAAFISRGNGNSAELRAEGADKDVFDNKVLTPLYLAARHGHVGVALALLAAGAGVSIACGGYEARVMHVATERENVEILRAVIEHVADVDAANRTQVAPLYKAASFNSAEAIHILWRRGRGQYRSTGL